jgi:hypothetical protein
VGRVAAMAAARARSGGLDSAAVGTSSWVASHGGLEAATDTSYVPRTYYGAGTSSIRGPGLWPRNIYIRILPHH